MSDPPPLPDPFSARSLHGTWYKWTEECHRWFQESARLVFMRAAVPFSKAIDDIANIVKGCSVHSYSIYSLYGQYDFLLVYWGTAQKHRRLHSLLVGDTSIEHVREYNVDSTHDTAQPDDSLAPDGTWALELERIYEGGALTDGKVLSSLIDANLIYKTGAFDHESEVFKIVVTLTPSSTRPSATALAIDAASIVRQLRHHAESEPALRFVVHDCGTGALLFEADASSFDRLFVFLNRLTDLWKSECVRSESFVVASPDIRVSDHLDVDWKELSTAEQRFLEFIADPEAGDRLMSLQREARTRLVGFFSDHSGEIVATPARPSAFSESFRHLLCAKLYEDSGQLLRGMTFLFTLEAFLSAVMRFHWVEALGKQNWYHAVKEIGAKINPSFDPNHFTMHDAIHVSNAIPESREFLSASLGVDWVSALDGASELRNHLAHGRVATDAAFVENGWWEVATSLLPAGLVYNRLSLMYDEIGTFRATSGN